MGIIDRIRKSSVVKPTKDATISTSTVKKQEGDLSVKPPTSVLPTWMYTIIGTPRISEKASRLVQTNSTYTFNVPISAEKIALRKAIEARYGVKVVTVRIVRGQGKHVRRGRVSGQRNAWKKALVELQKGQTIDLSAS